MGKDALQGGLKFGGTDSENGIHKHTQVHKSRVIARVTEDTRKINMKQEMGTQA